MEDTCLHLRWYEIFCVKPKTKSLKKIIYVCGRVVPNIIWYYSNALIDARLHAKQSSLKPRKDVVIMEGG